MPCWLSVGGRDALTLHDYARAPATAVLPSGPSPPVIDDILPHPSVMSCALGRAVAANPRDGGDPVHHTLAFSASNNTLASRTAIASSPLERGGSSIPSRPPT